MTPRPRLLSLAIGAIVLAAPVLATAKPLVVDRIVAVVDVSPILLWDLRDRARPFEKRLSAALLPPEKRAAAEAELQKELLEKLVDERLVAAEAKRRTIAVTDDEVTLAIKSVAQQNQTTVERLMVEVEKQGLSAQEYGAEIRRQLLEAKLLQVAWREKAGPSGRVAPATPLEAEAELARLKGELLAALRDRTYVEVRL